MADQTNKTDDLDNQPTGIQEDEGQKGGQPSNPNDIGNPSYTSEEEEEME